MTDRCVDVVYPYLSLFLLSLCPFLLFFPVAKTPALQNGQDMVSGTIIRGLNVLLLYIAIGSCGLQSVQNLVNDIGSL